MTEAEWNSCTDPTPMLEFLRGKVSERKLRLFGVACCRRVAPLETAFRKYQGIANEYVNLSERYADGKATEAELAQVPAPEWEGLDTYHNTAKLVAKPNIYFPQLLHATSSVVGSAAWIKKMMDKFGDFTKWPGKRKGRRKEPDPDAQAAMAEERVKQADLFRHIIGNPFQPASAPLAWPSTIVQLATALYEGQDCSFALHDALLEAGHPELAEHFKEKDHPKGCWVMDTILGKK